MNRRQRQIGVICLMCCAFISVTISSLPIRELSTIVLEFIHSSLQPTTMNIAFVCKGDKTTKLIKRAAKTLLFHRTTPANIHIIGDQPCYAALTTIVAQWNAYDVTVSFYPWEKYKHKAEWVPTGHYSGVFGILKLLMPEILPDSVQQVILLDTDIVLNADIYELWGYFRKMAPEHLIGAATELSPWYRVSTKWRAKNDIGFNTGVLLLNLERMRLQNWNQIWKSETLRPLALYREVDLGDQDIFNAVAKERPELVYELPCAWNVQWRHDRYACLTPEISDHLKLLHFNLPVKEIGKDLITAEFITLMEKVKAMKPPNVT